MGYLDQCTHCDRREHEKCDGTMTVMDQDGPQRLVCLCHHRQAVLEAQRISEAEGRVRRLMRDLGINRSHTLVRVDANGSSGERP